MTTPEEISMADLERDDTGHDDVINAIDAASGQGHVTWVTDGDGKRIAKIAPVDEIPDSAFKLATDYHDKIMAGFRQAYPALRDWSERVRAGGQAGIGPRDDRTLLLGIEARLNTISQRIGTSARDGEPGIIALLTRMEAIQAAMARQVEEIHRSVVVLEPGPDGITPSHGDRLAEHDGYVAHRHNDQPDHQGIARKTGRPGHPEPVLDENGVHAAHCCSRHGCKYGNAGCPVVRGNVTQEYPCEQCGEDGIPVAEGQSFAQWFAQFQGEHGWEADQYRSWLQAAWDAARSGRPEGQG